MLDLGLTLLLVMAADAGAGDTNAQSSSPPARSAKLQGDRVICKREVKIGTLAGYQRTCHTRAEWARIGRESKESWEQLQGTHGSTNERMAADILTPR